MQIDTIAQIIANIPPKGTLEATTHVVANGKAQGAVVEYDSGGYEAYVPDQIGPVATGSSIEVAESRLDSTVEFQA
jgi:predicted lipoprotein